MIDAKLDQGLGEICGLIDRNLRCIDHDEHSGWSRRYGIDLCEGSVKTGDVVTIGAL